MDPVAPDRILLVYDGSSVAERALGIAVDRARDGGSSGVTILAVIPPRLWRAKRGQFQIPPDKHDEEFVRTQIAHAKVVCGEAGIRCEGQVRTGPPVRVISEEAARGYGVVVLPSRPSLTGAPSLAALVRVPASCEIVAVS
jgi:nucleotide-binding universal stress UspA family protein